MPEGTAIYQSCVQILKIISILRPFWTPFPPKKGQAF